MGFKLFILLFLQSTYAAMRWEHWFLVVLMFVLQSMVFAFISVKIEKWLYAHISDAYSKFQFYFAFYTGFNIILQEFIF